ncbi:hypothetical protein BH23THE1_BH23THE1_21100 [soil metagenome]
MSNYQVRFRFPLLLQYLQITTLILEANEIANAIEVNIDILRSFLFLRVVLLIQVLCANNYLEIVN